MPPAEVQPNTLKTLALHPLAHRLGHLGLLPFVVGALLVWLFGGRNLDAHYYVSVGLSTYAGLIITFLGGIYWGLAFVQPVDMPRAFVWGIAPSAIAWVGVMMPPYAGLALHGAMLIVCYLVDRHLYPLLGAAGWLTLRFRLSAVAALCCFLAAAGS